MNKEILLVILMAAIFVLGFALAVFNKKIVTPSETEPLQQTIEERPQQSEQVKIEDNSQSVESTKPIHKAVRPVVKSVKKVSSITPVFEEKKSLPAQENLKPIANNSAQSNVYVDETSKDIVITTEYKMASPAKYSFK